MGCHPRIVGSAERHVGRALGVLNSCSGGWLLLFRHVYHPQDRGLELFTCLLAQISQNRAPEPQKYDSQNRALPDAPKLSSGGGLGAELWAFF